MSKMCRLWRRNQKQPEEKQRVEQEPAASGPIGAGVGVALPFPQLVDVAVVVLLPVRRPQ